MGKFAKISAKYMHPKELSIKDYQYNLPEEKIAKYPLTQRDQSKLLTYKDGKINSSQYAQLDKEIPNDSLMIFNNTKVVEARLLFHKQTGSTIELFCLEPGDADLDISTAMTQRGSIHWKCLIGGAKKWKQGALQMNIEAGDKQISLKAEKIRQEHDYYIISFSWDPKDLSFAEILHYAGQIPLPPYLHRQAEKKDAESYQTIYALKDGSVAAPTAGLHFTTELLEKLHKKGIQTDYVTLHVGAGTFKPVKSEIMEDHEMHAEFMEVSILLLEKLLVFADKKIIAVGTTSLRTLESLYWMGVKVLIGEKDLEIKQWDPYHLSDKYNLQEALEALKGYMESSYKEKIICKTQIIIAPGYQLKLAGGLVTNFHQSGSTLLLLVAAIIGTDWRKIYNYALEHDFRFLSYGDGCLIWANQNSINQ